ncbi:MAG TPA: 5'/3'-nucleotidase SurE [Clostridia bacterium]|nr:5'/3'-nucleotidase SurE [Clostridia bacterium]
MLVLLTNDDGFYADGLVAVKEELAAIRGIEIYVVAPDRERSASGHAITIHRPIMVQEVNTEGTVHSWIVSGTPADCVKLALDTLMKKAPDLVISGINRGPNVATDVFYSGTVSAALEAAMVGIPAIAISVAAWEVPEYGPAAKVAVYVSKKVLELGIPGHTLLNVNVPALEEDQIAGFAITRLGTRRYANVFEKRIDPRGRVYYWMGGEAFDVDMEEGTDTWALANNLISITPIHCDLTAHNAIDQLKTWNMNVEDLRRSRSC